MTREQQRRDAVRAALHRAHSGLFRTSYVRHKTLSHHNACWEFQEARQALPYGLIGFCYGWLVKAMARRREKSRLLEIYRMYDRASGKRRRRQRAIQRARFLRWRQHSYGWRG